METLFLTECIPYYLYNKYSFIFFLKGIVFILSGLSTPDQLELLEFAHDTVGIDF